MLPQYSQKYTTQVASLGQAWGNHKKFIGIAESLSYQGSKKAHFVYVATKSWKFQWFALSGNYIYLEISS